MSAWRRGVNSVTTSHGSTASGSSGENMVRDSARVSQNSTELLATHSTIRDNAAMNGENSRHISDPDGGGGGGGGGASSGGGGSTANGSSSVNSNNSNSNRNQNNQTQNHSSSNHNFYAASPRLRAQDLVDGLKKLKNLKLKSWRKDSQAVGEGIGGSDETQSAAAAEVSVAAPLTPSMLRRQRSAASGQHDMPSLIMDGSGTESGSEGSESGGHTQKFERLALELEELEERFDNYETKVAWNLDEMHKHEDQSMETDVLGHLTPDAKRARRKVEGFQKKIRKYTSKRDKVQRRMEDIRIEKDRARFGDHRASRDMHLETPGGGGGGYGYANGGDFGGSGGGDRGGSGGGGGSSHGHSHYSLQHHANHVRKDASRAVRGAINTLTRSTARLKKSGTSLRVSGTAAGKSLPATPLPQEEDTPPTPVSPTGSSLSLMLPTTSALPTTMTTTRAAAASAATTTTSMGSPTSMAPSSPGSTVDYSTTLPAPPPFMLEDREARDTRFLLLATLSDRVRKFKKERDVRELGEQLELTLRRLLQECEWVISEDTADLRGQLSTAQQEIAVLDRQRRAACSRLEDLQSEVAASKEQVAELKGVLEAQKAESMALLDARQNKVFDRIKQTGEDTARVHTQVQAMEDSLQGTLDDVHSQQDKLRAFLETLQATRQQELEAAKAAAAAKHPLIAWASDHAAEAAAIFLALLSALFAFIVLRLL